MPTCYFTMIRWMLLLWSEKRKVKSSYQNRICWFTRVMQQNLDKKTPWISQVLCKLTAFGIEHYEWEVDCTRAARQTQLQTSTCLLMWQCPNWNVWKEKEVKRIYSEKHLLDVRQKKRWGRVHRERDRGTTDRSNLNVSFRLRTRQ